MNRNCIAPDCANNSMARSRYCDIHKPKSKKKKKEEEEDRLSKLFIEKLLLEEQEQETKIREDRLLKSQQELDYLDAVRMDTENLRTKEAEIERKALIRQKFQAYVPEHSDITLQLIFPQIRLKIRQSFSQNSTMKDLFDFVDIVLEDQNVPQSSSSFYQLIIYPNQIFTKESTDFEQKISINHNSSVSICMQKIE
jgi:hypothetical protein